MSTDLYKLIDAVNNELKPLLPRMHSEKQRIEMRANLMALERMARDLRQKLLVESKNIKNERREKKKNRLVIKEKEENDVNSAES